MDFIKTWIARLMQWLPVRIAIAALDRFSEAKGPSHGGAVAFYAAFSIAPMLVVVTSVMVWLLGDQNAQASLLDTMSRLIGPRETQVLQQLLEQASGRLSSENTAWGSWLALGTTLIGATAVFVEMRAALQSMLNEKPVGAAWWRLLRVRLLAAGMVLGCGFLLSVALLVQTAALVALKWVSTRWPLLAPLLAVVEGLWSWAVITLLFAAMIRWLPITRLPKRDALIGAAVAAGLFMLGRYAISLYVATTATQSALGAAGSFAALLVWVYWSSQIFLLGAAVAVEIGAVARGEPAAPQGQRV
ncbi:YihY/virulence factor BrkB family protein [Aquincola tertiaricarbonis]|uniref:YihY/virulence factor BrkB family protein n=1 Tax=Aquincola tertiaricarbonis TaxID=391953 RepID=A0ABY4S9P2_AQUTE|nr:YihY/virulence factor BrkB family protein [Aquincola tertiaricarbonis]URI09189.1 YihY/virulence factor BrkB family protein [Aquincola tertiaricarbonis]